jgi:hypothetical protein
MWQFLRILPPPDLIPLRCRHNCPFPFPYIFKNGTGEEERVLISLGDWKTQFSYGEWTDGSLALKTFTD